VIRTATGRSAALGAGLFAVLLWGLAFTLSCRLAIRGQGAMAGGFLAGLLGQGRSALSAHCFRTADLYFHRGVTDARETAPADGFFARLHDRVSPRNHVHTTGRGIAEIMPWLELSIDADPANIEAYLVAAFWLEHEGARADLALRVLNRGQQANPGSYRIQIEKARLYLHQGMAEQARHCLDAALAFWPGRLDPASEDARYDRAEALLYRGLLHESAGSVEAALADFDAYCAIYPDRAAIADRAAALRTGARPEGLASELMDAMLRAAKRERATCPHEHGHDHEHSHEHGHDHGHGHAARRSE
jgi:tetratricopeptide (TPR) repeat protein